MLFCRVQSPSSVIDRQNVLIWSAGYFTIVHLLQYELSVIWDRKTTVHVQAGPRWQVTHTLIWTNPHTHRDRTAAIHTGQGWEGSKLSVI